MKSIVLVKYVPSIDEIKVDPQTFTVDRDGARMVMNQADRYAVEMGLKIRDKFGGDVTVLTMGPEKSDEILREALGMGANEAVRVTDDCLAGADTLVTARALAAAIKKIGEFDVVLLGNIALDGATKQVPAKLGALLGAGVLMDACKVFVREGAMVSHTQQGNGYVVTECEFPVVCAVTTEVGEPRNVTIKNKMAAKKKTIPVYTAADLGLGEEDIKSRSVVAKVYPKPVIEKGFIEGTPEEAAGKLIAMLKEGGNL